MLTRIANDVDALDAAASSVRHRLIQNLCQPFFEQAVGTLCGEISSVDPGVAGATCQKTMVSLGKDHETTFGLGQGLGVLEEASTDENDSSEGELDSRLFLCHQLVRHAKSYNMCQDLVLCQDVQELHSAMQ
jgi:hypothetical protein